MATGTIDLFKLHKDEYAAPKEPAFVHVKAGKYLAIEGQGKPGGPEFQACVGALYSTAYTIKMSRKAAGKGYTDYKVAPLEGQYWNNDPEGCVAGAAQGEMRWKLLIRVPDFITETDLKAAAGKIAEKGRSPETAPVKLEKLAEGKCVQALHVGHYSAEMVTVERMRAAAEAKKLKLSGPHHEIYLSDPRRVAPERLKTILRQPVAP